jgi:alanyl-tRNA synthetase
VGLIKIRRWEKVNQRVRVEFYCGGRALRDYRWKNRAIYLLSKLYSTSDKEVVTAAEQKQQRVKQLQKQLSRSQEALLCQTAKELLESSVSSKGLTIVSQVWEDLELKLLQKLAAMIAQGGEKRVVLFGVRSPKTTLLFMRSPDLDHLDARRWINEAAPLIKGKGGGRPDRAQAGGSRGDRLEQAVEKAAELAGRSGDPPQKK